MEKEGRNFLNDNICYDLLVDWDKRLANEMPFLEELIDDPGRKKTILDAACGTGRHAERLISAGYRVTCLDVGLSMVNAAKKRLPEAEVIHGDLLDETLLKDRTFDFIYCLGNSVGLMAQDTDYETIIKRFSQIIIKTGGNLVFHTLNFEKERNSISPPRSISTKNGEYIFIRRFSTSIRHIHPEITTLFRSNNQADWKMIIDGPANIPRIKSRDMKDILSESGFSDINLYGDYQKSAFDPSGSVDMIWAAGKI